MSNNRPFSNTESISISSPNSRREETKGKTNSNLSKQSGCGSMNFLEPFQVFCIQKRSEIQKTNPLLSSSDITSLLGKMWRSMDSSHRLPYVEMASQYNNSQKQNDDSNIVSSYSLHPNSLSNNYQFNNHMQYLSNMHSNASPQILSNDHKYSDINNHQNSQEIPNVNKFQKVNSPSASYSIEKDNLPPQVDSKDIQKESILSQPKLFLPKITIIKRDDMNSEITKTSSSFYFAQMQKMINNSEKNGK